MLDDLPEALAAHAFAGYVDEERMLGRDGDHFRADSFDVFAQRLKRFGINRDNAHFSPLSQRMKLPGRLTSSMFRPISSLTRIPVAYRTSSMALSPGTSLHFRNLGLL